MVDTGFLIATLTSNNNNNNNYHPHNTHCQPGVYTGCTYDGPTLAASDLLITTTDYPALPSSNPALVWSCNNAAGHRHLHIKGASNITFAGIEFASSDAGGADGGLEKRGNGDLMFVLLQAPSPILLLVTLPSAKHAVAQAWRWLRTATT